MFREAIFRVVIFRMEIIQVAICLVICNVIFPIAWKFLTKMFNYVCKISFNQCFNIFGTWYIFSVYRHTVDKMKNILVFCGANDNIKDVYLNAATGKWDKLFFLFNWNYIKIYFCSELLELLYRAINVECSFFLLFHLDFGKLMVSKELDLIYGYGKTGLMGCVAKAVHGGGRNVLGIMPMFFSGSYFVFSFVEVDFYEEFIC